jgi:hypothetical protein
MNLNMFYDFVQVLNINRKHPTKNEYFPKHIEFTTILVSYLYFPNGGRISIMSETNTGSNSNEYY